MQLGDAEGTPDANTLGWAARDKSAVLSPYQFTRRDMGPKDVFIKISYVGMCHSDLHTINGEKGVIDIWRDVKRVILNRDY